MNFLKQASILIIMLLSITQETNGQSNSFEEEILNFLSEKENFGEEIDIKAVAIPHLLSFQLFDGETIGIYKFVITGSHKIPYLFYFDGKEIVIVEEYEPETILEDSIFFINRYESHLTPLEKTEYFENILLVIKNHLDPPGWMKLPSN